MSQSWISLIGKFKKDNDEDVVFVGSEVTYPNGQKGPSVGNLLYPADFNNGSLETIVKFDSFDSVCGAEIIVTYDIQSRAFLSAGISSNKPTPFSIRGFDGSRWTNFADAGNIESIESGVEYKIKVDIKGSNISLYINEVLVCLTTIPITLKKSQVGFWTLGNKDIHLKKLKITSELPKAFTVMQFSSEYTDVYQEVIRKVCEDNGIKSEIANEIYSHGLIIDDITQNIKESYLVIAEVSENNPNVFYEVGYAHALNKPTILLAKKGSKLPFDVSPFRVLFYEDSISGKGKFEKALRKHIESIV